MKSAVAVCLSAVSVASILPFCGGSIERHPIEEVGSEAVTYQADDGVRIAASFFAPDEANPPVVILLHARDGSRAQWNEVVPILVDRGYAVLVPDLRGFGESRTVVLDGREEPYELTNTKDLLLDVAAALRWLESRDVDLGRIMSIGAGPLGADLAYVSTGAFPSVRGAVAISPSIYDENDQLLTSIKDFAAHDVYITAGSRDRWLWAVTLGTRVQYPEGRRYCGPNAKRPTSPDCADTPGLEGVALLTKDDPVEDILDFLKQRFAAETTTPAPPTVTPNSQPTPGLTPGPS